MPGRVMSIEVAPPRLTENPGRSGSRIALIAWRLAKSGSQLLLAESGASWPSAERVIWLPRSSIASPQIRAALNPEASSA